MNRLASKTTYGRFRAAAYDLKFGRRWNHLASDAFPRILNVFNFGTSPYGLRKMNQPSHYNTLHD